VSTEEETKILKEGLDTDPTLDALGNSAVACVRREQILTKWRAQIKQAVSEGAGYEEYAAVLLSSTAAMTESEKLALKLFDNFKKLDLPCPKTKEVKAKQVSESMVSTSHILDVINVSYLGGDLDEDAGDRFWVPGNAMKTPNKSWQVVLKTGKQLIISETKSLDSKQSYVKQAFSNLNQREKKKIDQKLICQRKLEQADIENTLAMKARKERKEQDCEEFKLLMATIVKAIKLGLDFTFEEFKAMVDRLRKPYKTEMEGHIVTVTENEKSVMMKDSALEVMKTTILGEKHALLDDEETTTNKKTHTSTNNKAAVNTVMGADGITALHNTNGRNSRQNREAHAQKIALLKNETKTIAKTLTMIADRKSRCEAEWEKQRQRQQQQQSTAAAAATAAAVSQQQQQQRQRTNENNNNANVNSGNAEIIRDSEESAAENGSQTSTGIIGTIATQQICTGLNCTETTGKTPAVSNPTTHRAEPTGATVAQPTIVAPCTFTTKPLEVHWEP
jgi:hypothetical protein